MDYSKEKNQKDLKTSFESSCRLEIDVPLVMKDIEIVDFLQEKLTTYEKNKMTLKYNELDSYLTHLKECYKYFSIRITNNLSEKLSSNCENEANKIVNNSIIIGKETPSNSYNNKPFFNCHGAWEL